MSASTTQNHVTAVEALMAGGTSKADAVKAVAASHGCAVGTVRGALARAAAKGAPAVPAPAPVDPITAARKLLEDALAGIDTEVDALKQAADDATAAWKAAKEGATARRDDLTKRITALS